MMRIHKAAMAGREAWAVVDETAVVVMAFEDGGEFVATTEQTVVYDATRDGAIAKALLTTEYTTDRWPAAITEAYVKKVTEMDSWAEW